MASSFSSKRAQSAMEFLMTYGWAVLVVLAAIISLAYFGVMSPAKFFPESCTLPSTSGMACLDFKIFPDSAHLFIQNGGGRDLTIDSISVGGCSADFGMMFPDGSSMLFNVTGCAFGTSGERVKKDIVISYTDSVSGFSKNATGSVAAALS